MPRAMVEGEKMSRIKNILLSAVLSLIFVLLLIAIFGFIYLMFEIGTVCGVVASGLIIFLSLTVFFYLENNRMEVKNDKKGIRKKTR